MDESTIVSVPILVRLPLGDPILAPDQRLIISHPTPFHVAVRSFRPQIAASNTFIESSTIHEPVKGSYAFNGLEEIVCCLTLCLQYNLSVFLRSGR
jgi:hypothetical protein